MAILGIDEPLRVLLLEPDAADAEMILERLAATGMRSETRVVESAQAFEKALQALTPDLVLSAFTIPGFGGLAALALSLEKAPEAPFIMISRMVGEDTAVETLKSGATDFVRKDNLQRLELAVQRALKERRERRERLQAESTLRESQRQLAHSQKLDALGRLSGGIAHDFNNILTAIMGFSELILADARLDPSLRPDVQEITNAGTRAAALTRQLLAFSRKQLFAPKIVDLNAALRELDRMLQRIIGEDVALTLSLDPALRRVSVDQDHIGQILLNLVVNARDAMPEGGQLTVSTSNVELDETFAQTHPGVRAGRGILLRVEDTGMGMDAATLARVFEPFFTTKSAEKGTGLGLSTAYGVVKQSGGCIEVASRLGRGSVFSVYLPEAEGGTAAVPDAQARAASGTETILVVDDDRVVGSIARRFLERRGYSVIQAEGGEQALRACAAHAGEIALVLTDVVMARMTGPQLVRRLREPRPQIKALYFSGYAERLGENDLAAARERFIAKPFSAEDLLRAVRAVLDKPG